MPAAGSGAGWPSRGAGSGRRPAPVSWGRCPAAPGAARPLLALSGERNAPLAPVVSGDAAWVKNKVLRDPGRDRSRSMRLVDVVCA